MSPRRNETELPGWLWFFLILPGALLVALLWRRRARDVFRFRFTRDTAPSRYSEPDSIPIEVRAPAVEEIAVEVPPEPAVRARASAGDQKTGADDLKVIEGIGPAIAGLLRDSGITTFSALADAPIEALDAILTQARLRRLADPGTWPEQARLAAEGRWDDLAALQQTLKAGRRRKQD